MAGPPRVLTIAAGVPFLDVLAAAVVNGQLPGGLAAAPSQIDLPEYTILLPTRRAARALQASFLSASRRSALLLPRIRPIADADEDQALLTAHASGSGVDAHDADLPPAVDEIERRLVLTQLVLRWFESSASDKGGLNRDMGVVGASAARTPAQAAKLAAELARLMDSIETEGADFARLEHLVPVDLSEHWQDTLDFLRIALEGWPSYLKAARKISAVARRNALARTEAKHLAADGSRGPIVIAGVTGSIPATAELMRAVMQLDNGAVVLPGLDMNLDDASWQSVGGDPGHPQFGLKRLLERLGIARGDVQRLGPPPAANASARGRLVSEAMRPAATTEHWVRYTSEIANEEAAAALRGLTCLELPSAGDETEAIALILREAAETPERTAALITPDRRLARRVAARLETWEIFVDDSAGRPFAKTSTGAFLDLVVQAVTRDFEPIPLMALLKHPQAQLGQLSEQMRLGVHALELAALRGVYAERGLEGLDRALERAARYAGAGRDGRRPTRRVGADGWSAARQVVRGLAKAYQPLTDIFYSGARCPIHKLAAAHAETADRLAGAASAELWSGDEGEAASALFEGLIAPQTPGPAISPDDYADFYRGFVGNEVVRARIAAHPRLSIWGPLESRLQHADVIVLSGLNDGTWPAAAEPGPWLSRTMRAVVGLPAPEQKIGLGAHDFAQLLAAPRVYLTRAAKIGGAPTVPSRWMLRLQALQLELERGRSPPDNSSWPRWARARDRAPRRLQALAPTPRPAVTSRPRTLSISDVETWIANPYAIFAAKILELRPLPPLGKDPDAALRGSLIHAVMSRFATSHPVELPADCLAVLTGHAEAALAVYSANPRVAAFWMGRLCRFAQWFAATEAARRGGAIRVMPEVEGALVVDAPAGPFTVTARADRIDLRAEGLAIFDYKMSANPRRLANKAQDGLAPQLGLEAAIATAGGFTGVAAARTVRLAYISASGGLPPGAEAEIAVPNLGQFGAEALTGLRGLVARFDDPTTPYRAVRRARFNYDYDDFAQLARVAEWAGSDDPDGSSP